MSLLNPLALDLATVTGFAARKGKSLVVGSVDLAPGRGDSAGMRFVRFKSWLGATHRQTGFGIVFYEQITFIANRPGQGTQMQIYGGLLSTLFVWCEENGIPYSGVNVSTIKSFATGKGNASKDMMLLSAHESLANEHHVIKELPRNQTTIDHNAADAYHLLRLVQSEDFNP